MKLIVYFLIAALCFYNVAMAASDDDDDDDKRTSNHTVTHEAWFEITIKDLDGPGDDYVGTFRIALFGETVPMTVLNFVNIAKGYKLKGGKKISYKNTIVHRVVQDFVIQMGDVDTFDGHGGMSIYGPKFNDENFILSHRSAGWVAMANHGPDTNNSQFYITLVKARWLDGKHVAFGKIVKGMDVIKTIGEVQTNTSTAVPKKRIKITDCGAEQLKNPYVMSDARVDSDE